MTDATQTPVMSFPSTLTTDNVVHQEAQALTLTMHTTATIMRLQSTQLACSLHRVPCSVASPALNRLYLLVPAGHSDNNLFNSYRYHVRAHSTNWGTPTCRYTLPETWTIRRLCIPCTCLPVAFSLCRSSLRSSVAVQIPNSWWHVSSKFMQPHCYDGTAFC